MIVDRTARRADVMIGSYATGDAAYTIGYHTSKTTPTAVIVINFLGSIGYIIINAIFALLILLITSGVVMTFSERLHSTNMEFVSAPVRFRRLRSGQVCVGQATESFSPMRTGMNSIRTEESALAGSKDLIDIGDVTEIEHAQQRETNTDVHLVDC